MSWHDVQKHLTSSYVLFNIIAGSVVMKSYICKEFEWKPVNLKYQSLNFVDFWWLYQIWIENDAKGSLGLKSSSYCMVQNTKLTVFTVFELIRDY